MQDEPDILVKYLSFQWIFLSDPLKSNFFVHIKVISQRNPLKSNFFVHILMIYQSSPKSGAKNYRFYRRLDRARALARQPRYSDD